MDSRETLQLVFDHVQLTSYTYALFRQKHINYLSYMCKPFYIQWMLSICRERQCSLSPRKNNSYCIFYCYKNSYTELTWERSSVIYNFDKCYTKIKSIPSRLSTLNHNSATKQISRWWKSITNKFEKHITLIIIVKLMNFKLLRETYIHLWNRYWAVFADHFLGQFPIYNKEQNCI